MRKKKMMEEREKQMVDEQRADHAFNETTEKED